MNTTLSARFPLEVFDCVGDVAFRAVDSYCPQGLVQNAAGWANKRLPNRVFFIAGLFANEEYIDVWSSFGRGRSKAYGDRWYRAPELVRCNLPHRRVSGRLS